MTNTLNKIIHNGDEYEMPGGISNNTEGTTSTVSNIRVGTSTEYGLITPEEGQISLVYAESGGGGWQPGVNTIAYYPLNSTTTTSDMKGTGTAYDLTNSSISFGTYQGVDCAYNFGQGKGLYITSGPQFSHGDYTFGAWFYRDGNTPSGVRRLVNPYGYGYLMYSTFVERLGTNNCDPSEKAIVANYDWSKWNLFIITFDSTTSTDRMYLNGELKTTYVDSDGTQRFNGRNGIAIGCNQSSDNYDYWIGGLSNVIVENKTWSDAEVALFYNSTKATYGIS